MSCHLEPTMMGDCMMRIGSASNGFTVEIRDPKIDEANQGKGGYRDPWRQFVFQSEEQIVKFITIALPKLKPAKSDFDSAYAEATKEDD